MFFIPLLLWARQRMRDYPGAVRASLVAGGSGVFAVMVLLGTSYGVQPPPGEEDRVSTRRIVVTVNGTKREADVEPRTLLVYFLREACGLTGTNVGCDTSSCGACTVLLDGAAVKSCTCLTVQADGARVTTIEGLSPDGAHPLQQAWQELDVPQCGYCQAGQIMSAAALLATKPKPTDADIDAAMNGNLCRCGTYHRVRQAVRLADNLQAMLANPDRILLEVGPGQTLTTLARQQPAHTKAHIVVTSMRSANGREADETVLLQALGKLWACGANVSWQGFRSGERRRRVPLPTYPFERQRHWIEPGSSSVTAPDSLAAGRRDADRAEPADRGDRVFEHARVGSLADARAGLLGGQDHVLVDEGEPVG